MGAVVQESGKVREMISTNQAFCNKCADWLYEDGWDELGRYFCPTCLAFVDTDPIWNTSGA